jgi:adenylate cyclase
MGEIAFAFNGTVDKHIGDSIMVVFGAPTERHDDTLRAAKTAMAMQQKAQEIDRDLFSKNGLRLEIGIGIATGVVFSGILGSLRRKEFTSIGMPVNIAARLQGLAQGGEILISDTTYQKLAGEINVEPLPPVAVKGIKEPITVYSAKYQ